MWPFEETNTIKAHRRSRALKKLAAPVNRRCLPLLRIHKRQQLSRGGLPVGRLNDHLGVIVREGR